MRLKLRTMSFISGYLIKTLTKDFNDREIVIFFRELLVSTLMRSNIFHLQQNGLLVEDEQP